MLTADTYTSVLPAAQHKAADHLTLSEILTVLPTWFATKTNNPDERSQHHMLAPATTEAMHALAHLTRTDHAGLARALPAFGSTGTRGPIRVAAACPRCAARRGIRQTFPISAPVHDRVCTRHGVWLSDSDQPHLDISACPEIIKAQRRVNRLLRRHTPQQLTLAHPSREQRHPRLAGLTSRHPVPLEASPAHPADHQPSPRNTR